jgi:hypothetical protein
VIGLIKQETVATFAFSQESLIREGLKKITDNEIRFGHHELSRSQIVGQDQVRKETLDVFQEIAEAGQDKRRQ